MFLRLDFADRPEQLRVHLEFETGATADVNIHEPATAPLRTSFDRVLEIAIPLASVRDASGAIRMQLSLWNGPLPLDALPAEGWLELG